MKISTNFEGQKITGVIRSHTKYFLEVEITSPFSNYSTSCTVPYFARGHSGYVGEALVKACDKLLVELFEFGAAKEKDFAALTRQLSTSDIPALNQKVGLLEAEFDSLEPRLRKHFRYSQITQKQQQFELKKARGLTNEARNELSIATDRFFHGTKFDSLCFDLQSELLNELQCRAQLT